MGGGVFGEVGPSRAVEAGFSLMLVPVLHQDRIYLDIRRLGAGVRAVAGGATGAERIGIFGRSLRTAAPTSSHDRAAR